MRIPGAASARRGGLEASSIAQAEAARAASLTAAGVTGAAAFMSGFRSPRAVRFLHPG